MQVLDDLGIDAPLVAALELGIKEPYRRANGELSDGVLAYPMLLVRGRRRYGYINLAGVTLSPDHPVAWGPGEAQVVGHGERGDLLVLASPLDVFRARSSSERRGLRVAAAASSQPDVVPAAWLDASFWSSWHRVILSHELPSAVRSAILAAAQRPLEISVECKVEVDLDDITETRLDSWLDSMLDAAKPVGTALLPLRDLDLTSAGDYSAAPMPVHGGFVRRRLFYPFRVERRQPSSSRDRAGARLLHSYETLIVRSDGAVLEACTLPAPVGTAAVRRVHALSDGTRIASLPEPSRNPTWSLEGIQAFVSAMSEGKDPCGRSPDVAIADVHRVIASRISLPNEDDLWVAALFVIMTHMFRVFGSLPILLAQGEQGTGKSELAAAIASLSFNAVTMGQGTAAALVRMTRECGGLVVLDDAEGLGAAGSGFGDLAQCLKVGYRASTARKPVTLPGGRVETFDFFGPRMITCTREVDPVLASRCVRLETARGAPADVSVEIGLIALRDDLHAIAMTHAAEVHAIYTEMIDGALGREGEIWAPLFAIAIAFKSPSAHEALQRAAWRGQSGRRHSASTEDTSAPQ